jgi:hypothetical protein
LIAYTWWFVGEKGMKVQNDNKRRVFRNLDEEDNFGIIVKILINLGVTRIIWGETRKSHVIPRNKFGKLETNTP